MKLRGTEKQLAKGQREEAKKQNMTHQEITDKI